MKLLNVMIALAFSLTLAVGMGSKSKPETPVETPKVLPESTRVSAPMNTPVALIENTVEDNQKIEKDLGKPTPQPAEITPNSKKAIKAKAPAAKKNKAAPVKKSTSQSKSKPKPKKTQKK